MKSIFTNDSLAILESFTFTKTLIAFDFDGTLSPIVKDPNAAYMSEKTKDLLNQLSKFAPTAIISGRSLEDLNKRVKVIAKYLVGNHGLESVIAKKSSLVLAQNTCQDWKKIINKKIEKIDDRITLEDKIYSLAIHYRKSRQKKETRLDLFKLIEQLHPSPRIILGKCVMNILPTGAPHKGVALLEFLALSKCNRAIYIGDDETDEDVFSLPDNRVLSIRVGKKKDSQAQYYIDRQSDINKFISKLIEFYKYGA